MSFRTMLALAVPVSAGRLMCADPRPIAGLILVLGLASLARADWPMPGHDPARSSWASQDKVEAVLRPIWHRKIGPYIPSKVQIITVAAAGRVPALVLVSTSRGLHALDPADGHELWRYPTQRPIDQSPTVVGGVAYFGSTDKTVHALDAATGKRIWQTLRAGAAFDTNPVVADGRVLLGCRDGHFYAFDAATGGLIWSYRAAGPISFSAAYDGGAVYFADKHNYVYALDARDGKLLWKSPQLPGAGFLSWWPVLGGQRILVPGTNNFAKGQGGPSLHELNIKDLFPAGAKRLELIAPKDEEGWIDARRVVEYYRRHPERQTLHVLDRATGQPAETAPVVFWGNSNDNRLPPLVGPEGHVFTSTAWAYDPNYLQGRIAAWKMGTALLKPFSYDLESFDEIDACAMIGHDIIAYNRGGDGADGGGLFVRDGRSKDSWDKRSLRQAFPDYAAGWEDWKYGNEPREGPAGTHGYQNPPVPLNGRVYFHRSNSVICYGTDAGPENERAAGVAGGGPLRTHLTAPGGAAEPAGNLPTVRSAEKLLADEIRRMIEAGHLRPVVANPSEQYWQVMRNLRGANMVEYWHNPAETIYTLLRALPHVPAAMRGPLKEYIQREWREYPPYESTNTGWGGASREIFAVPPEMQEYFAGKEGRTAQKPGSQPPAGWTAWSFNPFNFYACWLYAREFGGADAILARVSDRLQPPPADKVTRDKPHVLNCYAAGYIGYLGLEKLAGRPPSENVERWLRETQERRVAMLAMHPREVYTTEAGGFLYLVPEFGDYLHQHARQAVAKHVDGYNDLAPMWFLSEADEVSRAVARKGCPEGSLAQFYDYASLFAAKAFALKESRQELEKYLDVPGVWRGDLFYMQNLIATIEAHDKPLAKTQARSVRIAGIVLKWMRGDKEANLRRIEPMIRQAAARQAQIVVTTECFLDGYAIADKKMPLEQYSSLGEPIPQGKYYRRLAALAAELKIHLVAGLHEVENEKHYNSAVLIGPDGRLLGKYRKQELGHELDRNKPGTESLVFPTAYGRVGIMICADRTKPAIVEQFRKRGADFLLCPSGGMFGPATNDPILQARSRENERYITFVHPAEFLVTGPDGAIVQRTILGSGRPIQPEQAGGREDPGQVFYFDLAMPWQLPAMKSEK